jgi:hypothetical protein
MLDYLIHLAGHHVLSLVGRRLPFTLLLPAGGGLIHVFLGSLSVAAIRATTGVDAHSDPDVVEHWLPASQYPAGSAVLGIAKRFF